MPRGKKTRNQMGLPPLNVPGPAHWQDDFRSMVNSVMNQLLGRPSTREDTVFEILLATDEAILTCGTLTPPRRVVVSIDEHLSTWTPPEAKDPNAVMPEISELLVLLEADIKLPSAASANRQHQQQLKAAAAAAAEAASPEEALAVAAVEIRASDEARMERRLSVQNSLRKSFEKRLSRALLEELVGDSVLLINPEGTNVSNAFTMGPCFVAPPQSERAFPKPAQLAGMLAAPGGRAQLTGMLAASHGSKQRNNMTAALGAAALGPLPIGRLQLKPPQAQHALLRRAGRDLLAELGAGGPESQASPFVQPGRLFELPGARKRPGPPQMALPTQHGRPSAHESLEAWCEERGAALAGGVSMTPPSPYAAEASWTATFTLPACQATGLQELTSTVSAITRADAREQAAAHLLEQAKLRSFACLPPPVKRPRLGLMQS